MVRFLLFSGHVVICDLSVRPREMPSSYLYRPGNHTDSGRNKGQILGDPERGPAVGSSAVGGHSLVSLAVAPLSAQ